MQSDRVTRRGLHAGRGDHVDLTKIPDRVIGGVQTRGFDAVLDIRMKRIFSVLAENGAQIKFATTNTAVLTDLAIDPRRGFRALLAGLSERYLRR